MARLLYGTFKRHRDDRARDVHVYHECATGGLFLIETAEALVTAQRRWAIHTLDIPAARRRCMRYRIVVDDLP
ncbi:hypothetical protein pneo_cds_583 [Pandoravirus neocaledonia]|uniref:Uncharacterized protein n=1 Tax=Pandoravirus neocaledonia TaxID=2107708 RepID=A0A2U7UCY0_9VIRU|nr:hypothetical protein pneo_cds_583 [Pandoravirus neocaledonia]AVK76190.1 hypothetical protein pneo_cds_583 [Pandoravirus neocaledonia]